MAIRSKKLLTVQFTTTAGNTYTAADTAVDKPDYGTQAYKAFMRGDKVIPVIGETKCWLNFYAIESMCVTESSASEDFTDVTCVAESE